MIPLLFTVVFAEMALMIILVFKSPLRKLVIFCLNRLKQGRGPLVIKSVGGTMLIVFASTLYATIDIQRRSSKSSVVNPIDKVQMAQRLLEASLLGFALFLALMIDRQHYYIRELGLLRRKLEAAKRFEHDD